jgi:hypothetical protein
VFGHESAEGAIRLLFVLLAFYEFDLLAFATNPELGVPPAIEFAEIRFAGHCEVPCG